MVWAPKKLAALTGDHDFLTHNYAVSGQYEGYVFFATGDDLGRVLEKTPVHYGKNAEFTEAAYQLLAEAGDTVQITRAAKA